MQKRMHYLMATLILTVFLVADSSTNQASAMQCVKNPHGSFISIIVTWFKASDFEEKPGLSPSGDKVLGLKQGAQPLIDVARGGKHTVLGAGSETCTWSNDTYTAVVRVSGGDAAKTVAIDAIGQLVGLVCLPASPAAGVVCGYAIGKALEPAMREFPDAKGLFAVHTPSHTHYMTVGGQAWGPTWNAKGEPLPDKWLNYHDPIKEIRETGEVKRCDCDYEGSVSGLRGGCKIVKAAPPGRACTCIYRGAWTCAGVVTKCNDLGAAPPFDAVCDKPDKSYFACLLGNLDQRDCGGYKAHYN